MDQGALVNEQIEAGAKFLAEFQAFRPIQTAFWLKDSEERFWWLYVASEQISDKNIDVAYGEVVKVAHALKEPNFDMMRVKLIGKKHPLAKAAAELRQRYPAGGPLRIQNQFFGDLFIEEVYVYPAPVPVAVQ
jgi:hypothetical protein